MPFSLPHRRLPHGRLSASATWSSRSLASTSLSLPRGVTATKDPHSEDGAEEMRGVKTTTSVVAVVGDTDHQSHELKEKYNINCEVEGAKIGDRDDRDTGHSSRTSISTRTVSTETSLSAETSNSTFDISTIVEDVRASTSAVQEKKNYVHEAITSRGRTDDDGNPSGAGTSGSSKTSRGPRSGSHEDDKRRVVVDPVFLAEDSGRPPVLGNAEGETPYWSPETGFVPRHSAAAWHWLGDPVRSGLQNPEQDVLKYKGDAYSEQIGSGVFGWEDFPASSSETDQLCISPPEAGGSSSSGEAGSAIDEATSEFGLPLSLENSHFATQIRTAKDNTRLTSALLMCAEKRALLSIGFEKIQIVVDEVIGKICPGCLVFTIPYGSAVTGCLLEESSDLDVGIRVVPDRMGLRLADAKLEILSQLRNRLEDIGFARLDLVPARVPVLRCALREYSDYEADNVHSSLRAEFDISLHVDDYVFWNSVLLQQCLAQDWWTAEAAAEIHDDIAVCMTSLRTADCAKLCQDSWRENAQEDIRTAAYGGFPTSTTFRFACVLKQWARFANLNPHSHDEYASNYNQRLRSRTSSRISVASTGAASIATVMSQGAKPATSECFLYLNNYCLLLMMLYFMRRTTTRGAYNHGSNYTTGCTSSYISDPTNRSYNISHAPTDPSTFALPSSSQLDTSTTFHGPENFRSLTQLFLSFVRFWTYEFDAQVETVDIFYQNEASSERNVEAAMRSHREVAREKCPHLHLVIRDPLKPRFYKGLSSQHWEQFLDKLHEARCAILRRGNSPAYPLAFPCEHSRLAVAIGAAGRWSREGRKQMGGAICPSGVVSWQEDVGHEDVEVELEAEKSHANGRPCPSWQSETISKTTTECSWASSSNGA